MAYSELIKAFTAYAAICGSFLYTVQKPQSRMVKAITVVSASTIECPYQKILLPASIGINRINTGGRIALRSKAVTMPLAVASVACQ